MSKPNASIVPPDALVFWGTVFSLFVSLLF